MRLLIPGSVLIILRLVTSRYASLSLASLSSLMGRTRTSLEFSELAVVKFNYSQLVGSRYDDKAYSRLNFNVPTDAFDFQ